MSSESKKTEAQKAATNRTAEFLKETNTQLYGQPREFNIGMAVERPAEGEPPPARQQFFDLVVSNQVGTDRESGELQRIRPRMAVRALLGLDLMYLTEERKAMADVKRIMDLELPLYRAHLKLGYRRSEPIPYAEFKKLPGIASTNRAIRGAVKRGDLLVYGVRDNQLAQSEQAWREENPEAKREYIKPLRFSLLWLTRTMELNPRHDRYTTVGDTREHFGFLLMKEEDLGEAHAHRAIDVPAGVLIGRLPVTDDKTGDVIKPGIAFYLSWADALLAERTYVKLNEKGIMRSLCKLCAAPIQEKRAPRKTEGNKSGSGGDTTGGDKPADGTKSSTPEPKKGSAAEGSEGRVVHLPSPLTPREALVIKTELRFSREICKNRS